MKHFKVCLAILSLLSCLPVIGCSGGQPGSAPTASTPTPTPTPTPAVDFALVISPQAITVQQGSSAPIAFSVKSTGTVSITTQNIYFYAATTLNNLPSGVILSTFNSYADAIASCTVTSSCNNPGFLNGTSADQYADNVYLDTSSTATPGTYNVTVTAVAAAGTYDNGSNTATYPAITHTYTLPLTITAPPSAPAPPAPDFSLVVTNSSGTVTSLTLDAANDWGASISVEVMPLNGFTVDGAVNVTATGVPSLDGNLELGSTLPAVATPAHSIPIDLYSTTDQSGVYNVVFKGTDGALSHTVTLAVTVVPPAAASFTVTPAANPAYICNTSNVTAQCSAEPGTWTSNTLDFSGAVPLELTLTNPLDAGPYPVVVTFTGVPTGVAITERRGSNEPVCVDDTATGYSVDTSTLGTGEEAWLYVQTDSTLGCENSSLDIGALPPAITSVQAASGTYTITATENLPGGGTLVAAFQVIVP
jgi:hypothetical protein